MLGELRYSLRTLCSTPVLTATIVATLAIGLGSATAIFGVVEALPLDPLPYENAEWLVLLWQRVPDARVPEDWLSAGQYRDIVEQSSSFEELALFTGGRTLPNRRARGEDVGFLLARSSFFRVIGARPHLGRLLTAEDDAGGATRVAILTHELWQRRYGGVPDIVGKIVGFEHLGFEVVGVLEPGFRLDGSVLPVPGSVGRHDLILSMPLSEERLRDRRVEGYNVLGRLRENVTLAEARAELDVIASRMRDRGLPQLNDPSFRLDAVPLLEQVVGKARAGLWGLLVASGALQLLVCANVAFNQIPHRRG